VRSAYHMIVDTELRREAWLDGRANTYNVGVEQASRTSMSKVQVPAKLNIFLWRLARQSLPTADVVCHRKMSPVSNCKLCGSEDSWRHSLLECNMARCVWALENPDLVDLLHHRVEPDAKRWNFSLMDSLPHVDFVSVLMTLWAIWHAWRKAIHEGNFENPEATHNFIKSYVRDRKAIKPKQKHPRQAQVLASTRTRWSPPEEGFAKLKVDGAVSKTTSTGASGAVSKDSVGKYLGASALVSSGVTNPSILEAMACREAMALAKDLSLTHIVIASD
jgi:hypothetical protein